MVRRAATLAVSVVAVTSLLAGCGSSGGEEKAAATTAPTTTEAPTTTTTEVDTAKLASHVQDLLETADGAIDDEVEARDAFASDNDLDGAIDSTRDLREALYDFDGDVRDLKVPHDLDKQVNALLTADGGYIDALDGFLEIEDIPAYNDQLDRETEARGQWYDAVDEVASALEIDGVDNDVDGASSTDDDQASDEPVQAGDVVSTGTVSIQVPEGFTATASATIQMTDENGNTIGIYSADDVDDPDSVTLDQRAKAFAEGVADKNGYKIVGGPEKDDIGEYPAVGYALATDETHTEVELIFEAEDAAGTRFHLISIEAADSDIDAIMAAIQAVEDTLAVH